MKPIIATLLITCLFSPINVKAITFIEPCTNQCVKHPDRAECGRWCPACSVGWCDRASAHDGKHACNKCGYLW